MRVSLLALFAVLASCISVPLSQQDKIDILNKHNELRGKIARGEPLEQSVAGNYQPPAANMREMEWSPGIEAKAAEYAEQQTYAHSSQAFRTYNDGEYNGYHGENLYWAWTSANNYGWKVASGSAAAFGWVTEEEKFYHYVENQNGACYGTPVGSEQVQCGHYTQGVWATSHLIGCASAHDKGDTNSIIVICQYNGGNSNINGVFDVYKKGTACSQCPSGFSTCKNGLCSRGTSSTVPASSTASSTVSAPAPAPAPTKKPTTSSSSSSSSSSSGTSSQGTVSVKTTTSEQKLPDGSVKTTTTTVTTTTYPNGSSSTRTQSSWTISWPSDSKEMGWDAGNTEDLLGEPAVGEETVETRRPPLIGNLVNYNGRNCLNSAGQPCNPNRRRLMFGGVAKISDCKCE